MAFLIKNVNAQRGQPVPGQGYAHLFQFIHVTQAGHATDVNATPGMNFRVFGGRILVHRLVAR